MFNVLIFAVYTAASVSGLLILRYSLPLFRQDWQRYILFTQPMFLVLLGAILYIISFATWLVILARYELSIAYPTAIGLTLIFSTLGATFLMAESLNAARIAGIFLIFGGICLVARY